MLISLTFFSLYRTTAPLDNPRGHYLWSLAEYRRLGSRGDLQETCIQE